MAILKLCLFLLWVVLLPLLIGFFWSEKSHGTPVSLLLSFFYGIFLELALFEILAVPMVFLKCSLVQLSLVWLILSLAFAVFSLCKSGPSLFGRLKAGNGKRFAANLRKRVSPLLIVVIVCVLLQVVFVTFSSHIDDDDAFYVATAVTARETNTLMQYNPFTGNLYKSLPARYIFAAWPLFLAALSTLSGGLHPTLIAHLLLPGLVLLFAYGIYALIARELFPGEYQKQDLFLLIIILVLSFSGFSVYSSGTFLLIRGWQGKALVAGITQPALFYLCRRAMIGRDDFAAWFHLFCAVTSACMFSSMGVVLATVPVGVYTLIYMLGQKRWRYLPCAALSCSSAIICGIAYLLIT
ncbi:MAG: DUF6077 domain-containing protein [Clostridiales bacterium]|nr:DUF6077 domain-containing protein [Clostridiales bacterium]